MGNARKQKSLKFEKIYMSPLHKLCVRYNVNIKFGQVFRTFACEVSTYSCYKNVPKGQKDRSLVCASAEPPVLGYK